MAGLAGQSRRVSTAGTWGSSRCPEVSISTRPGTTPRGESHRGVHLRGAALAPAVAAREDAGSRRTPCRTGPGRRQVRERLTLVAPARPVSWSFGVLLRVPHVAQRTTREVQ